MDARAKAEDQYKKKSAAFSSVAAQILCLSLRGQTLKAQQEALDPDLARHVEFCELLARCDAEAQEKHRELEEKRKKLAAQK